MDSIINLTLSPDVYMITMFLLLGISCRTLFLFLLAKYEGQVTHQSNKIAGQKRNINARHSSLLYFNPMLSWLTIFIKRKESPPDDEDHHLLLTNNTFF